ncbi:hypothetical protein ACLI1A_13420 [Flavobacterium sp. RHBU_3]|uniref:hypothetical protein n=1 Tax=Flavobacterium sp. RHBU_3 TaxID=3391184 RepID=UPI00398552EA
MDFTSMDIAALTRSVTGEGRRYLELFLREYTALFPGPVNPGCPRCLQEYLNRYKNHFKRMSTTNTCQYRLHERYENIPLQFGSPILVNNDNITDEYAKILINQPNGIRYFSQVPDVKPTPLEDVDIPAANDETTAEEVETELENNTQQ